jgi:hypothetical protein
MKKSLIMSNASKKERRAFNREAKATTERLYVKKLLELLPDSVLESVGASLKVDKWTKKLKAPTMLNYWYSAVYNGIF